MVINATQIRVGMILNIEGELYRVTWTMHRTPGKGNACMQTKLKHLANGKNLEMRFLSNERVDKAELMTKDMQCLYPEGDSFVFMDLQNYEQVSIPIEIAGESHVFIKDGETYPVTYYNDQVVGLELPKNITLQVIMAPPDIKRATATATLKTVELENGMSIQAPGFVKEGDKIKINTQTFEYVERVS